MKISVLVSSRKDSKFLAHFIMGYLTQTADLSQTELLVMYDARDTWNQDLIKQYDDIITFVPENYGLGRWGLHVYMNELAKLAKGDWMIGLCEDMGFITPGWDQRFLAEGLDPHQIWMITPHFKPLDLPMAHLMSRGYYEVSGKFSELWGIDSWLNLLAVRCFHQRIRYVNDLYFYDCSHDPAFLNQFTVLAGPNPDPEHIVSHTETERVEFILRELEPKFSLAMGAGR